MTASRLDNIGEYYFSKKLTEIAQLNKQGKQIINLGIGSPDLPAHRSVVETLANEAAVPGHHSYQGYRGVPQLRSAFALWYKKWYGVDLDADTEILPLIGSKEGIMHICMTYLNPGDFALVPNPGYPTYSSAVKLAGGIPLSYNLTSANNWKPDFQQLEELVRKSGRVKLLFLNYPHMPTGQLPDMELFERSVSFARKHNLFICHDNPYSFILNDHPMSMLAVPNAKDVVMELNSLSKSHNMAGWRVGVLCGAKDRIDEVLRFKSNMDSGMFLPVQLAAVKALSLGEDWHRELNAVYTKRQKLVLRLLEELGCIPEKNQAGMFVWAGIPNKYENSYELSDRILYEANVFLTPGGIFGTAGEKYLRVSLCSPESTINEAIMRIQTSLS